MQEERVESQLRERAARLDAKRVIRPGTLHSTFPLLGPVITWGRRLWNGMAGRWYVDPALEQTNAFNEEVVRAFEDIASLYLALSCRVEETQRQLLALHDQVELLSALPAEPSPAESPWEPSADEQFWNAPAQQGLLAAKEAILGRLEGESDEAFERRFEDWGAGDAAQIGSFCHPTARVLEIGCGIGRILKHIVAGERWGCDVSEGMLRLARTYLGEDVRLVHINGIDLTGIPDDYFDLVYSVLVFQHIDKRAGYILLCETRRVLKPGGHFFLEFMNLLSEQTFQSYLQVLRLPYPLEPYTPDEVRYKVAKAGLEIDDLYLRGEGIYVVGRKPGP